MAVTGDKQARSRENATTDEKAPLQQLRALSFNPPNTSSTSLHSHQEPPDRQRKRHHPAIDMTAHHASLTNQPTKQPTTRSHSLTQITIPHQRSGCRPSIHPYVRTSTLLTNYHDHCTALYFTLRYFTFFHFTFYTTLTSRPPIASRRPEWHFLERDPRMAHFFLVMYPRHDSDEGTVSL